MRLLSTLILAFCFSLSLSAQKITAGPMLGYNTMREVAVWVQLHKSDKVQMVYWPKGERSGNTTTTAAITTHPAKGNTAIFRAELLEPGTTYEYKIISANTLANLTKGPELSFTTQSLWQWRTDPPAFNFLAGSCVYTNDEAYDRPGKPYGGEYEIFTKMAEEDAQFMMWLGDNTYLREADWNSRSGIYYRYGHTRATEEMQPILRKMHHYAIWDDHDYGPNDSDGTYWNKRITLQAFKNFWANPNYGVSNSGGITGAFTWNDCQFFLLDNRWNREPQGDKSELLGEEQIEWLINSLRGSKASFKFVCVGGQLLSDLQKFENHAIYAKERKHIIEQLDKYNIPGVIILNGDRHSSEITKLTTADGDIFYDVTASPLTSGSYDHSDEANTLRIPNTMVGVNSYAKISITGAYGERKCLVEFKDKTGKVLVSQQLAFPAKK